MLFEPLASIAGTWELQGSDGPGERISFQVSSAGSAVREIMFPGTEHEMTNMYTLDGNSLVMTHYCAGGNQPHMRATGITRGSLTFEPAGVSDLSAPDEPYMATMTLVFVDEDHIEEHWTSMRGNEVDHEMTLRLQRVR